MNDDRDAELPGGDGRVFRIADSDLDEAVAGILDRMPMPAWAIDDHCQLIYVNHEWEGFTGRDADAEAGESWLDGVLAEDRT